MWFSLFILFCSFPTGVSNTFNVFQTPPFISRRIGESVDSEIYCSHRIPSYDRILWYKQDKDKALKYLGYLNLRFPSPENDVTGKISFNGDGSKHSNLTVYSVSLHDSGVYFCAASRHSAASSPQVNTKTLHLSDTSWTPAASLHLNQAFGDFISRFNTTLTPPGVTL